MEILNINSSNDNLNTFLKNIFIKKQYLKSLKKQFLLVSNIKQKNYKLINTNLIGSNSNTNSLVTYIIDITFSISNAFFHVTDSTGNLKFFSSAGYFKLRGKNKKFRFQFFKHIYRILLTKLRFLKKKPIALHLKNVGSNKFWIIKKLKTKFYIKTIKIFNIFPFNGCRKKKVRRKKF